ncbi:collagen-like protein, partial [Priestia megaterium]
GVTGVTGTTGATGTVTTAYGYVFNTGTQTVNANADVVFNTTGPLAGGVSFTAPSTITVTNGGVYQVMYEIVLLISGGNTAAAYALRLNNVNQTSTTYGLISANALSPILVGTAILTIPSGATLTIRNVGTTNDTLETIADGATIVNASFRLIRLS